MRFRPWDGIDRIRGGEKINPTPVIDRENRRLGVTSSEYFVKSEYKRPVHPVYLFFFDETTRYTKRNNSITCITEEYSAEFPDRRSQPEFALSSFVS